jgi:hypothetical protein
MTRVKPSSTAKYHDYPIKECADALVRTVSEPLKNITVIIDRVRGSRISTSKAEIEQVLEALKSLMELGLRVRVCRSHTTLKEDKVWRR